MNRISTQSRPQILPIKPEQDEADSYYSANPKPLAAKAAPPLTPLDLMYAYYEAA